MSMASSSRNPAGGGSGVTRPGERGTTECGLPATGAADGGCGCLSFVSKVSLPTISSSSSDSESDASWTAVELALPFTSTSGASNGKSSSEYSSAAPK